MRFGRPELPVVINYEPQPLGVDIDPASAELWEEFMAPGRGYEAVYRMWEDPEVTNPGIRQRAVTVLTAPSGFELPYAQPDEPVRRLLNVAGRTESGGSISLARRFADRPFLARELAAGVLFWLDETSDRTGYAEETSSRYDYQRIVRELLPVVDEETGDRLFSHFSINDIEPYWNMDDSSGYNPAQALLRDADTPARYKDAALDRWFAVAQSELAGAAEPRAEWEGAVQNLGDLITLWAYGGTVDQAVHGRVVEFLESNLPSTETYVAGHAVARVAQHVADPELRFWLGWRHILAHPGSTLYRFSVHGEDDVQFLEWMRAEAAKRGLPDLETKGEALMAEYRDRVAREAAATATKSAAEEDILSKLRSS